jgi:ferredoxin
MNVSVDKDICIGCAVCESICPDVFEMQDTVAVVKVAVVPESMKGPISQAAESCPVTAISIQE